VRPGNSGGGKDPDFWCAFDAGEEGGLAVSLATPDTIRNLQRKLYGKAKAERKHPAKAAMVWLSGGSGSGFG
jgi:RNA-directed DNA polymerase